MATKVSLENGESVTVVTPNGEVKIDANGVYTYVCVRKPAFGARLSIGLFDTDEKVCVLNKPEEVRLYD